MSDLRGRIRTPEETQRLQAKCLELLRAGLNRTLIGERLGLDRKSVGRLLAQHRAGRAEIEAGEG